jgi:hypothetical protein
MLSNSTMHAPGPPHPSAHAICTFDTADIDLPLDVLHEHVLPRCSIDIRMALKVPPRRLWHGTTRHDYEQRVLGPLMVVHQRRQACYRDHAERDWITLTIPIVTDGVCSPIFRQEDGRVSWADEIEMVYNFLPLRPHIPTSCEAARVRRTKTQLNGEWEPVYLDGWVGHRVGRAPGEYCSKHPEDLTELWRRGDDPTYVVPKRTCACA